MAEKLYVVPQGWEWKKLGDLSALITKGSTPTTYGYKYVDKGINFIKIENISDGQIQLHTIQSFITEEAHQSQRRSILQENDILFSIAGTIGESCIVSKEDLPANTNQALAIIRLKQDIDPHYVRLLLSSEVLDEIRNKQRGGALKNISLENVKNALIPLPPLEEQRWIVGKLDWLFAKIDKSIALLDESIASASALMPSTLNEVFEELEEKWEKESIEKIAHIIDGDRGENYPKKDEFFEKEYCLFLSAKNVTKNGFVFKENQFITKEKDSILRKGRLQQYDLVLTTRGTIGNVAFFDDSVPFEIIRLNSGMVILRVFNENINHKFLYIFLNSPIFESFLNEIQNGAAQPQISIRNFKSLQIPLPPLDIQAQTVAYLDALHVKADALKKAQEKKKEALLALKASLLESAFKGEL